MTKDDLYEKVRALGFGARDVDRIVEVIDEYIATAGREPYKPEELIQVPETKPRKK